VTNIGIKERRLKTVSILDADPQMRIGLRFGASTVELQRAIQSLLEEGQDQILLNLKAVSQIDAQGLANIVWAMLAVSQHGGNLKLVHVTERMRELISSAKLLDVFDVYEDEPEAIESFPDRTARLPTERGPQNVGGGISKDAEL
jgi:anti-sigma B factor antagonist